VTELVIKKKRQTKEDIIERDDISDSGHNRNPELKHKVDGIFDASRTVDITKNDEVAFTQQDLFDKIKTKFLNEMKVDDKN